MPPKRSRFTSGGDLPIVSSALMNAKAEQLGLSDTHFENPHGLDEPGHVSSARDVTALVRYALGIPFVRDALSRPSVSLPGGRTFESTDDLLVSWPPLVGGKTGHTHAAGWSQTAAAQRGAHGLRRRPGQRHAERSQRCAGGAADLRARPVPRCAGDRPDARVRERRDGLRPARRRARCAACARALDPGRASARRASRGADRRWRFRSPRASGSVASKSSRGTDSSHRPPSSQRRQSPTLASGRRRSGTRRRRCAICGRCSRDRHRDDERGARPHADGARSSRSVSATARARC